ncbi:MAG: hypothetical protein HOO88_05440 [Kiritimatiellaceae bacterium]|nr:hypothetical protein [Kiritimatiellaceae bacterium]
MSELISKLSSYNLFNYLLPGIVFVVLLRKVTGYNMIQENILVGAFFYYFVGMLISRVGSLFVEPVFKWIKFLRFAPYKAFVKAAAADQKIEVLSEVNNTYRTLVAMFVLLLFSMVLNSIETKWNWFTTHKYLLGLVGLLVLFIYSYRKQTNYIRSRVEAILNKE